MVDTPFLVCHTYGIGRDPDHSLLNQAMTRTPNTAAELIALNNQEPATPYDRPQVEAAMQALSPVNGGNLGDLQAVAELCISILKDCAKADSEDLDDPEFAEMACKFHTDLCAAEALLDRVAYIAINEV